MALTLEQKKSVIVKDTLKGMGMTQSAAGAFSFKFRRSGYNTAILSEMIRDTIYHDIEIYRKQTYATFGMGILVDASGPKDPVFEIPQLESIELTLPLLGKVTVGYRQYEFAPYHNEQPWKTMDVRLHLGRIQVHICGSWQPVSAYLDEVGTDVSESFNAEIALTRQPTENISTCRNCQSSWPKSSLTTRCPSWPNPIPCTIAGDSANQPWLT
jgi:hypothetical protein